jgi:hypothetical protein
LMKFISPARIFAALDVAEADAEVVEVVAATVSVVVEDDAVVSIPTGELSPTVVLTPAVVSIAAARGAGSIPVLDLQTMTLLTGSAIKV